MSESSLQILQSFFEFDLQIIWSFLIDLMITVFCSKYDNIYMISGYKWHSTQLLFWNNSWMSVTIQKLGGFVNLPTHLEYGIFYFILIYSKMYFAVSLFHNRLSRASWFSMKFVTIDHRCRISYRNNQTKNSLRA